MAKKINEEDLKNVSGGGCNDKTIYCTLCGSPLGDECYQVTVENDDGVKTTTKVCLGHYDMHHNNPRYSNWKKIKTY